VLRIATDPGKAHPRVACEPALSSPGAGGRLARTASAALVIGYNLAFDLARLAADWREVKKGRNVGAWNLVLWTFRDPATGEERPSAGWRPCIIIKRKAPDVVFIEFTGRRADGEGAKGSRYRGEFLDLSSIAP
jgi:hypothetical protein